MDWPEEDVAAAEKLVRDVYEVCYAPRTELLPDSVVDPAPPTTSAASKTKKGRVNPFDEAPVLERQRSCATSRGNGITRYLDDEPVPSITDPVKWWSKQTDYDPRLARMAMYYLTIPGA